MATLAEIRRRIASVKNTQQITRAMQAVAASKLRRVQARAEAARPYADRMADVLTEVASRVTTYQHPFLIERPVKKLLVVKDDAAQRASVVELIGNTDVKTTAVGNGQAALAALKDEKFDCLVLDLKLPDMSGFEARC